MLEWALKHNYTVERKWGRWREAEEIYMSNLYAACIAKLYIQTQICTVNIKGRVFHHAAWLIKPSLNHSTQITCTMTEWQQKINFALPFYANYNSFQFCYWYNFWLYSYFNVSFYTDKMCDPLFHSRNIFLKTEVRFVAVWYGWFTRYLINTNYHMPC
jgi:hypothetical protein